MASKHFDAIIIGAGQSGPALAERLAQAGLTTAYIERKHFGGTCVNTGCTPTKALVASAYVAHMARRAREYGVSIGGPVSIDMKAVKARKDAMIAISRNGVRRSIAELPGLTVYQGHGRFTGPHTVAVNGDVLTADKIFINTGGRAAVPPIPGLEAVDYLTNTSMLNIDFVPPHLLIIGGSYIGLEFAQIYRRFGSRVTVIEMADRLIPREDPDVSAAVLQILEDEGIDIRLGATCVAVARDGDRVTLSLAGDAGAPSIVASHLLLAVGRRPNTDDLGLDAAGIATDQRGYIVVDGRLRTTMPGVWALGDVNGRGTFTHTSYNDYEIVAADLFDGGARRLGDRIACYGLFIDPPLGRVGMSEREVRAAGIPAAIACIDMEDVSRAWERGETKGFMKIIVDTRTDKILGAALLGLSGDELVHAILEVMAAGAPYTAISRTVHIHPTVAEFLPVMLKDLQPLL